MHYLKGTVDYKLVYGSGDQSQKLFTIYTNANYRGNKNNGRSTGGYVTCISSVAIGWRSTLQPFVTLSTTEAEYVAAVEAEKN
jgi:hypothetical protein